MDTTFWSLWIPPMYLAMIPIIAAGLKIIVVPTLKSAFEWWPGGLTHERGYTPIILANVLGVAMVLLTKVSHPVGAWSIEDIAYSIVTGIVAAFTAIGFNVTTAALRSKDVSITR